MSKVAVIIPAMNERGSIKAVIQDIQRNQNCAIFVIDDASLDSTDTVAREAGARVFTHVVNLGAWKATQTGIRYALMHDYDYVVTMDGDGQHKADQIKKLLKGATNKDLIIGSCLSRGTRGRHIAWRFFKSISRLPVSDLTSGFRCYSRNAMKVLASEKATMFEYQDVGVLMLLRQKGLTMGEVQVSMVKREFGISRIFYSWKAVFKYLVYTGILSGTKAIQFGKHRRFERVLPERKND